MNDGNILLGDFNTLHDVVPFDKIKTDDYLPAIDSSIKLAKVEIDEIIRNQDDPDFNNTIEALDRSGERLNRISSIFFNLVGANTSDTMQQLAQEISPKLTEFYNDIFLDETLFKKVKAVYDRRDQITLNTEQQMLLYKTIRALSDRELILTKKISQNSEKLLLNYQN